MDEYTVILSYCDFPINNEHEFAKVLMLYDFETKETYVFSKFFDKYNWGNVILEYIDLNTLETKIIKGNLTYYCILDFYDREERCHITMHNVNEVTIDDIDLVELFSKFIGVIFKFRICENG